MQVYLAYFASGKQSYLQYLLADQERYVRALMDGCLQDRNFLATYHSFNFRPLKYEEFTVW